MSRISIIIPASLLAASGFVFAQSTAAPASSGDSTASGTVQQSSGASGTSGTSGSAASGTVPTTEGNKALDSNVRGPSSNASTSDHDTSRRWTGVGSTGGATGTGTSSGTTDDPPATSGASGGMQQGSSASGGPAQQPSGGSTDAGGSK
ncbi:hypothetical protein [Noviherbaspirillum sp.]|uniref:hypothetical protein n=1 Tax=Noviherbaspirillum sp. TaxID=1926288 RepID=UPI002D6A3815|nr:hypothetical protein [Noviherbaspirillum sp.]HZW23587.1 hypothetical protein [Noviherbaspirillum sp.]